MISQSPAIVDADSPYDPTAFADTIIRTSDNVHFYILGNFLSYVSQVFRDLFDLNRGAAVEQNEKKDGHPIIPLLDDSATLRLLLYIDLYNGETMLFYFGTFLKWQKILHRYCRTQATGSHYDVQVDR